MHDDQRSSADDVFAVIFVVGALLCMAVYALVVYVIIPLVIFAAVVGVIGLIIAGMVCYVRSHTWLLGGFIMLLLYCFALALVVYTTMLAHTSMTDSNAASPAVLTGLLLLLTLVVIARLRPVVRRRDAEAERAELQQQLQQELLESERQARHEAAERRKREETRKEEERQERAAADREEERLQDIRRREAEEMEEGRHERFRTIQVRYGDAHFAWRTMDEELTRYAREHRTELLDPKRTKEIIRDYYTFNDEDLDFVEWLRINHTDLYHRIDEVFYYRARTIAESLPKDYTPPKPPRPKLTPEERQAKFERYRERALERDRIQAQDRMAAVRQKLDLVRQFREDLDAYDLDEDERDRYVKEFENDLLTPTEEYSDGFKKL